MASLSSGDILTEVLPPGSKEEKESLLSFQLLISEILTIAVPSTSLISRTEKEKSQKKKLSKGRENTLDKVEREA